MKRLSETQKTAIQNFRADGLGYKAIAEKLSLSRETVRSFCVRQNVPVPVKEKKRIDCDTDEKNEILAGNTVFLISTDYSKKATDTLENKLKALILSAALNQSGSYQFVQN